MRTSYKLSGIEPPDLVNFPNNVRKMYWQWVVDFGLKRKDKELSEGLDKDGKALKPILAETRKHRRSEMTPTGRGSPSAPPLTPGYQKSRTRSLLAGRAFTTHAEFFWLYDPHTGDSWGVILADQAKQGRNVFGLSPAGTAWVQAQALRKWNQWKAGNREVVERIAPQRQPVEIPQIGSYNFEHATWGIGATSGERFKPGQYTGGMTADEWEKYYRKEAKATIPGRPKKPYNVLLSHIWPEIKAATGKAPVGPPGVLKPKPTPRAKPLPIKVAAALPLKPPPVAPPPPKPIPLLAPTPLVRIDPTLPEFIEHRARIERGQQTAITQWAEKAGLTPEEYIARVGQSLQQVTDQSESYIRVSHDVLGSILGDKRFKNQFETGRSSAAFDTKARADVEAKSLGISEAAAAAQRPIYGYLSAPNFAAHDTPEETFVGWYGEVTIRLKPSVRARSSVTFGDSMNYRNSTQASMVSQVEPQSVQIGGPLWDQVHGAIFEGKGEVRPAIVKATRYIETQIHGGLPIDEIQDVVFREAPSEAVEALLKAKGIPWRVKE
jgi:hypothetical protein